MPTKPPLPQPTEPMIDPKTGLVTPSWYRFFKFITDRMGE